MASKVSSQIPTSPLERSFSFWNSTAPPPTRVYQCAEHGGEMLKQLDGLLKKRVLCDGTLICGEHHFSIHRIVLASCSDFFHKMFVENENIKDIQISTSIPRLGLEMLIHFAYTSQLTLNIENVRKTLYAAIKLGFRRVTEYCVQYLITTISLQNCVELLHLAEKYDFPMLLSSVQDFVIANFVQVSTTRDFPTLTPEQITYFIRQDRMMSGTEMELFGAAAKWINHSRNSREQFAPRLMKHIRFPLISTNELVDHVQSESFMMENATCHEFLLEALNYHLVPQRQHLMQSARTRMRSTSEVILVVGGELANKCVSNNIMILDEPHCQLKHLTSMPLRRVDHSVAVLNDFLYVAGGQVTLTSNGKESIGTVHRYDPRFNNWLQVCPMQQRRAFFGLAALDGKLFAIGGKNEQGALASMESYNPNNDTWVYVQHLPESMYAHACCVISDKLYISGGFANHNFRKTVFEYSPQRNEWTQRCSMNAERGFHMLCAVRDQMFAMGGNHLNPYGDRVDVMSVERYNPSNDQWTPLSPMLTGLSMAGSAVIDNQRIYIIGGYNGRSRHREKDIHCYTVAEDEWDVVGELPAPALRMACYAMTLPSNLINITGSDSQSTASQGTGSLSNFTSVSQQFSH
ncbi:kelch-like protein 9 [Asterias rubens]|uniref:kelch-like protein 9 n=1 Tax=Asterias rubens TaxID=7604 RepID=UPI0014554173|nr:kelch-like protein 9 [Asterias rubens]XP_033642365.1 kelch-like protein 9 [Asterias rubens]